MNGARPQPSAESEAETAAEHFADSHRRGFFARVQHFFHTRPEAVPVVVLLVSVAAFGLAVGGKFFSPIALTLILQQVAVIGIVAAGQTLVILTAGIDLSVGAIMVLSSVVMGQFTFRYGLPPSAAVACGFAAGALCGAINGLLVSRVRLPPFIVTLGTWQIFLATNYLYSENETIRSQDISEHAPLLQFFAERIKIGGATFTYGVFAMLILAAVLYYALKHTAWGRHIYAVGDDPDAAQLAGVRTRRTILSAYLLAGLICALAGWVLIGRQGAVSPQAGQLTNIDSITAVVIGGVSLFGGRGSVLGVLCGALTVGVFNLGLRLAGADPQWTYLLVGLLIIVAVAADQWIRKIAQ